MIDIFQKVKGRLIVSCQAEEGSPFNSPEGVGAFAQCAAQGTLFPYTTLFRSDRKSVV